MTTLQKSLIIQYRRDGAGFPEIAQLTNLPISTVKSFCYRNRLQGDEALDDEAYCEAGCDANCETDWWEGEDVSEMVEDDGESSKSTGSTESADSAEPSVTPPAAGSTCPQCGRPLPTSKFRPRRFCSDECRRKYWATHTAEGKHRAMTTCTCQYCGGEFTDYAQRGRKYCSHSCYVAARFGGERSGRRRGK